VIIPLVRSPVQQVPKMFHCSRMHIPEVSLLVVVKRRWSMYIAWGEV